MFRNFLLILLSLQLLSASQNELRFGVLSVENNELVVQKLKPFIEYLEKRLHKKVIVQTGYDYANSIHQLTSGEVDFAYLGPVPYIKAKKNNPQIQLLAALQNCDKNSFQSVIVVKKGSPIKTLRELKNKKFAFGSPDSTLSYYIPHYMLLQEHVMSSLQRYDFLGRHDRVAQYVIMGKYDAGGLKASVANKYKEYLDIIAHSPPYEDFVLVASSNLRADEFLQLQNALLEVHESKVCDAFKKGLCGFKKTDDAHYNEMRQIMHAIEE